MSTPVFAPADYLDFQQTDHAALFDGVQQAWEILPKIGDYLAKVLKPENNGKIIGQPVMGGDVFIGENTIIEPGVYIKGPAWIGPNCQLRHGAYIRENVIVGAGCVVGNSCEIKNSILFNGCQIPHFNYVGDSILGAKAHLGAGVIVSNFKLTGDFITVRVGHGMVATGLRKFGALIGDGAEVGCNAMLNPGSVLGRKSMIYPGVAWRGVLAANAIAKAVDCVRERVVAELPKVFI